MPTRHGYMTGVGIEDTDGKVALRLSSGRHPHARLRDTLNPRREWIVAHGVILPKGALLTHITTQRFSEALKDDHPRVEVFSCDHISAKQMNVAINVQQLMDMIDEGVVEMDSSSGEDENLHYRYDHYLVI